jgi:hypothetical protein
MDFILSLKTCFTKYVSRKQLKMRLKQGNFKNHVIVSSNEESSQSSYISSFPSQEIRSRLYQESKISPSKIVQSSTTEKSMTLSSISKALR